MFALLRREEGTFEFRDHEAHPLGPVVTIPVQPLVAEGRRRLDEWAVILRSIPSLTVAVEMVPFLPDEPEEITVTAEQWRLLARADGRRSVSELADLLGEGEFRTLQVLHGLVTAGLARVTDVAPSRPVPEAQTDAGDPPRRADVAAPRAVSREALAVAPAVPGAEHAAVSAAVSVSDALASLQGEPTARAASADLRTDPADAAPSLTGSGEGPGATTPGPPGYRAGSPVLVRRLHGPAGPDRPGAEPEWPEAPRPVEAPRADPGHPASTPASGVNRGLILRLISGVKGL